MQAFYVVRPSAFVSLSMNPKSIREGIQWLTVRYLNQIDNQILSMRSDNQNSLGKDGKPSHFNLKCTLGCD